MMRAGLARTLCLLAALAALPGRAEPPATSLIPRARPGTAPAPTAVPAPEQPAAVVPLATMQATLRPRPRPAALAQPAPQPALQPTAQPSALLPLATIQNSMRPRPRPENLGQLPTSEVELASVPVPDPAPESRSSKRKKKKAQRGAICGDPEIVGEKLAPISSKVKGCGVAEPIRVTEIAGIRLSQPATINCQTAVALHRWIEGGLRPAMRGRKVVELEIAASYICRPRNNVKGNKISEHGRGNAIDIAGFTFSDGTSWTVLNDYNAQIRRAHKAACGIFGTTLGPGSDGFHENHLHFDTAHYNYGPYCR